MKLVSLLLKYLFFCAVFTAFLGCKTKPINLKSNKPNIVFILVDDLGYSDLSCMGSNYYETPNIDSIANSGIVFTNGYAGA